MKKIRSIVKKIFKPFLFISRVLHKKAKSGTRTLFSPSPRGKVWWAFWGIILGTLFFVFYSYPPAWNKSIDWLNARLEQTAYLKWANIPRINDSEFKLGLDLQGGAHLVYEAELSKIAISERAEALEGVRDVIERRVNFLGVSEPLVQISGKKRLIVELAGVFDVNKAITSIGETPLLEFKEQNNKPARKLTKEEQAKLSVMNKEIEKRANDVYSQLKGGNVSFEDMVAKYSDDRSKEKGGNMGWISKYSYETTYAEQASKLQTGKISDVFKTSRGFSIIRLNDKRKGDQVKIRHLLVCYDGAEGCKDKRTKEEALKEIEDLKAKATTDNFEQLVKDNSTEPGADENGGELGFISRGQTVEPFDKVAFLLEKDKISDIVETKFGYHLIYNEDTRKIDEYNIDQILFEKKTSRDILGPQDPWLNTGLSGKHLNRADVRFDQQTSDVIVGLTFNKEGKKLFAEITKRNLNKPVAIFLDGQPISVPRVNSIISNGEAIITGNFSINEAKDLVRRLNAGALPVPIKLLSQQTVGPKLGRESLDLSVKAALLGLILVALVMIVIYKLNGLIAVFSLLVYGVLVLGVFKLIGVTLTLSGIAGFILSLGMAVDANVLIFERIKEELRIGKPFKSAMDEGFRRAWPSIRDGNFSTLITCFILMQFGTSIVKGFAITLAIGIVISMFTAMTVTKNFLKILKTR